VVSKLLQEDDDDTIDSVLELYGQICIYFSKLPDNSGQECKFVFKLNILKLF